MLVINILCHKTIWIQLQINSSSKNNPRQSEMFYTTSDWNTNLQTSTSAPLMYIIHGWYNRPNKSHKTKHGSKYLESQNHIHPLPPPKKTCLSVSAVYHATVRKRQAMETVRGRQWVVSEETVAEKWCSQYIATQLLILQMNWTNTINEMTWDTNFPRLHVQDLNNTKQSCKCTIQVTSITQ